MTTTKKTPDDQPFDFNLDAVLKEADWPPFRVHFGGRRWEFMHLQMLDVWDLLDAAGKGNIAATVDAFRAGLGDEQFPEFRKIRLPQGGLVRLFNEWQKHCGIDPGESPGSTDS